jgi:CRP/FNR family cyclic AMP-dependent transcriptional regulator
MDKVEVEKYPAGKFIFLEGDRDLHFYIIQSGDVEIFTQTKDGSHHLTIAKLTKGDSFGEFAMLDDRAARSATARAITEVEVVKISAEAYEELIFSLPVWASAMLRTFTTRLKLMNQRIKDVPQFLSGQ